MASTYVWIKNQKQEQEQISWEHIQLNSELIPHHNYYSNSILHTSVIMTCINYKDCTKAINIVTQLPVIPFYHISYNL